MRSPLGSVSGTSAGPPASPTADNNTFTLRAFGPDPAGQAPCGWMGGQTVRTCGLFMISAVPLASEPVANAETLYAIGLALT